ncbi:hypothetical protein R3P38DRAFT_2983577 [Favolaschia claudopus]|uniref:Uncharacterized protein n=1 Tax=Favolaschia claudopus TaxID=2862362 RepID=A0AAW0AYK3_9AGAR
MPAAKATKSSNASVLPLLDISSLVTIQEPFTILADGRKRKRASAFCVDVQSDAFDNGRHQCFLKIFPADSANTIAFNSECQANHALNLRASGVSGINAAAAASNASQSPLALFKTHLKLAEKRLSWPLCYGYVSVADPFYEPPPPKKRKAAHTAEPAAAPKLHGLLFQYHQDLTLLSANDIDEEGTMQVKILAVLASIHAARILHRDLEERTVWPEAGFRNIFLKDGEPVILDFDHSYVLKESEIEKLEEEEVQMKELMLKALERRGHEKGWGLSKEAKRLL